MQHDERIHSDVAKAQELLVRLIIDANFREKTRSEPGRVIADFDGADEVVNVVGRASYEQLERFNDIVEGTRFISLQQKYAAVTDAVGSERLDSIIRSFLREVVIADGRGDMDVKLFDRYCRDHYPSTVFANLVSIQTARFLAAYGCKSYWPAPVSLQQKVTALRIDAAYESLSGLGQNPFSAIVPGAFFYVVMPHGTEIAFHEIDGDSYALLKEIELLNEARDKDALARLLEENRELLEVAASEGIVALCS